MQLHPIWPTVGALSRGQSSAISAPWCANVMYTTAKESTNRCVIRKTTLLLSTLHSVHSSNTVYSKEMLSFSPFSSSDYEAFKEAAEHFQPYIKFFATFEKSVSNKHTNKQAHLYSWVTCLCCFRWPRSWLWSWTRSISTSPSWRSRSPSLASLTPRRIWWNS